VQELESIDIYIFSSSPADEYYILDASTGRRPIEITNCKKVVFCDTWRHANLKLSCNRGLKQCDTLSRRLSPTHLALPHLEEGIQTSFALKARRGLSGLSGLILVEPEACRCEEREVWNGNTRTL